MTTTHTSPQPVTVLGLGAMGTALAGAFLAAGHPTTVWNRTPGRAGALAAAGATEVPTSTDAITASALTVVCVLDRGAVDAVLDTVGDHLAAATIVNFTSSTPEDARALAERVTRTGARYLDGTIMVPTPVIGTSDALVLYSGDRTVFEEHRDTLRAIGGDADLLGADPGRAAIYDLAMLDIFFNGMAAFVHAAALVGADGVSATTFLPYANRVVSVLQMSMPGLAANVDGGTHPGEEDNLDMELAGLDHIVHASEARGLDVSVPAMPRTLARTAIDRGHGRDSFSRVIDVIRQPISPAQR